MVRQVLRLWFYYGLRWLSSLIGYLLHVWFWLLRRSIIKRSIDLFLAFSVLVSIEKIDQTFQTLFDDVFKHFQVRQKYSAPRLVFNYFVGDWTCGETQPSVFDI